MHTTLYIVRHGQTHWNKLGKMQGHADIELLEEGEQQAQQLSKQLLHIDFDAVFSSDLVRAKRTAEIVKLERELAVTTTHALREQSFGELEGMDYDAFKTLWRQWKHLDQAAHFSHKLHPSMESADEAIGRFIIFLREIGVSHRNKKVLIVCHGALMKYFLIHLGVFSFSQQMSFGNCGHMKIRTDGVDFFVDEMHNLSHIVNAQ